ncbi:MAG TPA: PIG-L family deacetylase [Blastocatellia bacterium]|nr:PIG-L family deacetylase [Blastocatellia bacterium]
MTLRIIAFGAHPDDCELSAGGVAAKWAAAGHKVKFVATTNGDAGHFEMSGTALASRRKAEVERCAEILGITTEVLDIHDGELMPTLENRKLFTRLIREWQADIVLCHRPNDYHPDHRHTGVLVEDSAVLVVAKFFVPEVPALSKNPIFLYYSDNFQKPYPFDPAIIVATDDVIDKKRAAIEAMPSQFADRDSWLGRYLPNVPEDADERRGFIREWLIDRDAAVADKYRALLVQRYGAEQGAAVKYAEAFELCQYGAQPSAEELQNIFPL